jgi:antitoxin component of RelBE/YafQ-DinJ toxin-antitoxin module
MATISFKADDNLKHKLDALAQANGINTSAYIKLILTRNINNELVEITENGLTLAEELEILEADKNGETLRPFDSAGDLIKHLKKK